MRINGLIQGYRASNLHDAATEAQAWGRDFTTARFISGPHLDYTPILNATVSMSEGFPDLFRQHRTGPSELLSLIRLPDLGLKVDVRETVIGIKSIDSIDERLFVVPNQPISTLLKDVDERLIDPDFLLKLREAVILAEAYMTELRKAEIDLCKENGWPSLCEGKELAEVRFGHAPRYKRSPAATLHPDGFEGIRANIANKPHLVTRFAHVSRLSGARNGEAGIFDVKTPHISPPTPHRFDRSRTHAIFTMVNPPAR